MNHPLVKWSLRLTGGVLLALTLGLAGLLGYLFYGDDTLLPPRVEKLATLALGRPVRIEGDVLVEPSLAPRLSVRNLTVANADWGQAPHLLRLGRIDIAIRLLPLFRGVVEILSVELENLDVQLETSPGGRNNWDLWGDGEPGRISAPPLVHTLEFRQVAVTYRTPEQPAHRFLLDQALLLGIGKPRVELNAEGELMGQPFTLRAKGENAEQLLRGKEDWPLEASLDLLDGHAELSGRLRGPLLDQQVGMDLSFNLDATAFETIDTALDLGTGATGPLTLKLTAIGDESAFTIGDFSASLGPSDLSGELSWNANGQRPKLTLALKSSTLDIKPVLNVLAPLVPEQGSGSRPQWRLPDPSVLREADADMNLAFGDVRLEGGSLRDLNVAGQLRGGRIELKAREGKHISLTATANTASRTPRIEIAARLARSDLTARLDFSQGRRRARVTGEINAVTIDTAEVGAYVERFGPRSGPREGAIPLPTVPPAFPVDADLKIRLGRLVDPLLPLESLSAAVQTDGSVLELRNLSFMADGTNLRASATLDVSGSLPKIELSAWATNFEIGRTLPALIKPGTVRVALADAALNLTAEGKLSDLAAKASYEIRSHGPGNLNIHAESGKVYRATLSDARLVGRGREPIEVELIGQYEGLPGNAAAPVRASGTLNDTESLLFGDGPYTIDATVETNSTSGTVKAVFSEPKGPAVDAHFSVSGTTLADLGAFLETPLPDHGPYLIDLRLTNQGDEDLFDLTRWEIGNTKGSGRYKVNRAPPRTRVEGQFDASVLDIADIVALRLALKKPATEEAETAQPVPNTTRTAAWPLGSDGADNSPAVGAKTDTAAAPQRVIPNFAFDRDILRAVDWREVFSVKRLSGSQGEDLGNIEGQWTLEDGRLVIGPLTGAIAGSRFDWTQSIDTSVTPAHSELTAEVRGFDLGAFLKAERIARDVEGSIDLKVDLKGDGHDFHGALGASTGRVVLTGSNGKVPKQLMRLWGGDLTRALIDLLPLGKDPYSTLNCIVLPFDVSEGNASAHAFLVDTTEVTVLGTAKLDLKTEAIQALVTPKPKNPSLFSLAIPLEVSGTLGEASVRTTDTAKAWAAGRAVIGFINPLTIPFLFGSLGQSDKDPCALALEELKKAQMSPAPQVKSGS